LPKYYYTMSYTTAMMKKHIKFIIGVIFSIILLTLCESWLFSDYEINWLEPINDQPDFDDFEHFDWNGDVRARRSEREFFESHKEPWVHSQRCDACRLIAGKFHFAFELAESKLGIQTHNFEEYEELADEDIEEVTRQVCSKVTYKYVRPIKLRNIERLATRGLETMYYLNLPQSSSESITTITWPRRMRNHCKHLVKNMIGRELYDMWLKTSVGEDQRYVIIFFVSCLFFNLFTKYFNFTMLQSW